MSALGLRCSALLSALLVAGCGVPGSDTQSATEKLASSATSATSWLRIARAATSDNSVKADIDDVVAVLKNRQIVLMDAGASGPCQDNTEDEFTLAYVPVPVATGSIHVCAETMQFSNAIIAQVLIHEAIHGAGNTNECATTKEELLYMTLANKRPFKNAYVDSTSNPDCSSYNLGSGINFIVLDDGNFVVVPHAVHFIDEEDHAPHGARYVRAKRSSSLLERILGRDNATWISNAFWSWSH